jgi:hypothetical protein
VRSLLRVRNGFGLDSHIARNRFFVVSVSETFFVMSAQANGRGSADILSSSLGDNLEVLRQLCDGKYPYTDFANQEPSAWAAIWVVSQRGMEETSRGCSL